MNVIEYVKDLKIAAPCYVSNMPAELYHAHDSVSNSGLKLVNRSPAHFKYQKERESTRSMVVGSALHMACLEPDLFYQTYTLLRKADDRRSTEYKEAVKLHREELVLVASECERVEGIMKSLHSNANIKHYLDIDGWCELSGFVEDPETGIVCRHRFDKLTRSGIGIDLKTTTDARNDAFSRSIMSFGYHVQDAFYNAQYNWINGVHLADFIFIAIESESPYASKIYRIDSDSIDAGEFVYREALNKYAYCKQMNEWPAYDDEIEGIGIPYWAFKQHENSIIESFTFTD